MENGTYGNANTDFSKLALDKFPATLFDSLVYSQAGCGANALGMLTGINPNKIKNLNSDILTLVNSNDTIRMLHRLVTLYTIPNMFMAYYKIQKKNKNNDFYTYIPVNYHASVEEHFHVPYKRVRIPINQRYMWEHGF